MPPPIPRMRGSAPPPGNQEKCTLVHTPGLCLVEGGTRGRPRRRKMLTNSTQPSRHIDLIDARAPWTMAVLSWPPVARIRCTPRPTSSTRFPSAPPHPSCSSASPVRLATLILTSPHCMGSEARSLARQAARRRRRPARAAAAASGWAPRCIVGGGGARRP